MKHLKKAIAVFMGLLFVLSLIPAAAIAKAQNDNRDVNYLDSGLYSEAKMTKAEITDLLLNAPSTMIEPVFIDEPSVTAPYATGSVNTDLLSRTTDRLNALRAIAGLKSVTLDAALSENAQYGAVLLAASSFSHYPAQPSDMDNDFYQLGLTATSSSNISAGRILTQTPDGFMDDSDGGNIPMLGHRRWQLNPAMGKIGFGYVTCDTGYGRYTCEKAHDRSASYGDYDFISWPSSGNFPNGLIAFGKNTAWSVTLNPNRYSNPVLSDITVTITREADGQQFILPGTDSYTAASSGRYLNVNLQGYGVSNCIVFRPEGIDTYSGVYTVHIDGLKNKSGTPVDFDYRVDFFEPVYSSSDLNEALNVDGGSLDFFTSLSKPFLTTEYNGRTVGYCENITTANTVSYVTITLELNAGDTLSFDYRYYTYSQDYFKFSVNGTDEISVAGTSGVWKTGSFTAPQHGSYTFKWSYIKNANVYYPNAVPVMLDNIKLERAAVDTAGDINSDGVLDFTDVSLLFSYLLNGDTTGITAEGLQNADLNDDGVLSISDITLMYNLLLGEA